MEKKIIQILSLVLLLIFFLATNIYYLMAVIGAYVLIDNIMETIRKTK